MGISTGRGVGGCIAGLLIRYKTSLTELNTMLNSRRTFLKNVGGFLARSKAGRAGHPAAPLRPPGSPLRFLS